MTDKTQTLTETDDEELIVVETPPADAPVEDEKAKEPEADADEPDADEDDDEDERLAESDDDHDADISANRKRRQKRREVQKQAKERAQQELAFLRQKVLELERRTSGVEGHVVQNNEQSLETQLRNATAEVQQAEMVIAKATTAGNGDDVVAALRFRDAAADKVRHLQSTKQQLEQARTTPQVDPTVVGYAQQWMSANPWYDPSGGDADSALTKRIDNDLVRDGFNPATRQYWEELTKRVSNAFGPAETDAPKAKRKAPPPTGGTREHAPTSTKNEIYVTPERKQAMIDAGVWDDPAARQRYLKAYKAYDTSSAR